MEENNNTVDIASINKKIEKESAFVDLLTLEMGKVIVGQKHMVERLLIGLLGQGHILLEGVPGLAKTLAINTLSQAVAGSFSRIQFTPDLLPADVVGTMIYNIKANDFTIKKGPIFANFVLADEINRAPAKVQSALLEAMQEKQVTIGDETFVLDKPFLVMATQNPQSQTGTFPLPESQLDRFLMRLSLGYPNPEAEQALLMGDQGRARLATLQPVLNTELLSFIQQEVVTLTTSPALIQYVHRLVQHTRQHEDVQLGLSPRGAIALVQAAKAWAYIEGRLQVLPEDVQSVFVPIASHRLIGRHEKQGDVLARQLLAQVPVVAGAS